MTFQTYNARLVKKVRATNDIYILTFELPGDRKLEFTAGQYLILHVPQENGDYARRLYSIANPPHASRLELILKRIENGAATKYADSMKEDDTIVFQAPAGLFTLKDDGQDLIMLATNTGIAPFRSMILNEMEKGPLTRNIHLYWGMWRYSDLYLFDEFVELTKKDLRFQFTVCLSRDMDPHDLCVSKRIDAVLVADILPHLKDRDGIDFYICGGVAVIDTLRNMLLEKGLEKKQIFFEKFI
jgi:NAD(P)H-flavin reductase